MKMCLNKNSNHLKKYSLILLAVWLLSLFIHTSHLQQGYIETLSQAELQTDCHFCQNSLDKPQDSIAKVIACQSSYRLKVLATQTFAKQIGTHFTPPLRAPPIVIAS